MALVSLLRIRSDCPKERAMSGRRLAPKRSRTTTRMRMISGAPSLPNMGFSFLRD
jgi:hypothetical protein